MSSACNKRNFKRRRNGRSHSVFNIWNRDKHGGESEEAFKLKLNLSLSSPLAKDNDNYQKYGLFHLEQRHFLAEEKPENENDHFSSFIISSKLSKATSSTDAKTFQSDGNGGEISKFHLPPPLSLSRFSPISTNWCQNQTTHLVHDGEEHSIPSPTLLLPPPPLHYTEIEKEEEHGTTELELMPKSIPLPPPSSSTYFLPPFSSRNGPRTPTSTRLSTSRTWHRQQLPSSSASNVNMRPHRSSKVPRVARLIRLLSLILRVTCISHYCSKLFSFLPTFSSVRRNYLLPTFDLFLARERSKQLCELASPLFSSSWLWSSCVASVPPSKSESCPDGNCERDSLSLGSSCTDSRPSGHSNVMKRRRKQSLSLSFKSSAPFSASSFNGALHKRVRCQISSVRSDFIYIIVFALCVLLPRVAPVITSNEVFPMDSSSASNSGRAEAEISVPVEGVVGKRVDMPCDISSNRRDDSVYMVLWFRGDESIPIYSLDVRGKHFSAAKHWSAEVPFGKRSHFQTTSEPARLIVEPVNVDDQGTFRCRVDFRNSPSRESRLNLTVIVPPQEPQIFEQSGMNVRGEVGPYREGGNLELTCVVRDGNPSPLVLWYMDDRLIDSSYHVENENQVINHISLPNIQRSQHRASLECRARNTVLISPVSKTVSIELNLRPLSVSILQRHSQLSTNTQYEITCESWGSHPPPTMTWFLEGQELKGVTTEESRSSNTSVSRLLFTPTPEVDGKRMVCRAANPLLPGTAIEDFWQLRVVYSPILSLRLGSSMNPNAIKSGDDVYFECRIKSNPPAVKLSWFHNGQMLQHNRTAGVIVSNQSLALQKVGRPSAGNYSCRAVNQQGEGESNEVRLGIMYAPACRNELSSAEGAQPIIIAASRSEDVNVTCEMDALPDTLRWHWVHTNTVGEAVDLEPEIYTSQGSKSFLFYNLRSEEDFGTLLCFAANSIGSAEKPCIYNLVPADIPQPVENCSIINRTSTSVEITCEPQWDGGLPQSFYLEAFQAAPADRRGLYFNISSSSPTFSLSGLDPDGTFHFKIYSVNRKGKSAPSIMDNIALHYPAMQSAKVRDLEKTTIAIIIGAVSAVVLSIVSLIIFIVHRIRNPINAPEMEKSYSREFRPSRRSSTNDELYHHNSKKATHATMDMPFTATNELDEEDPDLIPSTKNLKTSLGKTTYSRVSNGEINQRYGVGHVEKIPLRSVDPDLPLTMEQHSTLSNYATFRNNKPNGYGIKHTRPGPPPRPIVSSTSGSFHGKPSSVVVNIDTRLIGQQLASNQLPESCV